MNHNLLCFSLFITLSFTAAACGETVSTTTGGNGGQGGTGAQGGQGGSGAQGGQGGTGAQGGQGGSGAGTPATAQCTEDAECKLLNDCCSCVGLGPGEAAPPCELEECLLPECESKQLGSFIPQCQAGQCVAGFECDQNKAACDSLPPNCPAGETATVVGLCWGPCVRATECSTVASCDQCGAGRACVKWITKLGPQIHCVDLPSSCGEQPSCECMGAAVCTGAFDTCSVDPQGAISCSCPACG